MMEFALICVWLFGGGVTFAYSPAENEQEIAISLIASICIWPLVLGVIAVNRKWFGGKS